jgi:hypothetical protein
MSFNKATNEKMRFLHLFNRNVTNKVTNNQQCEILFKDKRIIENNPFNLKGF